MNNKVENTLLISTLITNIGNGLQFLAINKIFYDLTGSIFIFGINLIIQAMLQIIVSTVSGRLIDKISPTKVFVLANVMIGSILTLVYFITSQTINLYIAQASFVLVMLISPVIQQALFALIGTIISSDRLKRFYGQFSMMVQVGQLLGCALAALIFSKFTAKEVFLLDGISYAIAGTLIGLIIPVYQSKPQHDITTKSNINITSFLNEKKSVLVLVLLSICPMIVMNAFNLFLMPLVDQIKNGETIYISLYDGAFAIGAMSCGFLISSINEKFKIENYIKSWLLTAVFFLIVFSFITYTDSKWLVFSITALGFSTSLLHTCLTVNIQKRIYNEIRGRISSVQTIMGVGFITTLVPIFTKLNQISILYSQLFLTLIVLGFLMFAFIYYREPMHE